MSHPTRESFRQFSNLDPQARLDEFQKRFDRMKSEFHNTPTRQMFESTNRPYYTHSPHWTDAHNQDAQPANGHVPVEKTIPIQVQHERSRSEPVEAEGGAPNSAAGHNNIPPDPRMHFMPDNSYFQHKFQSPFTGGAESGYPSMPNNTGSAGEETSGGGEPRVHRIPIQVETRSATNAVPMGYSKSASSPSPTPSGGGGGGSGSHYVSSQGVPSQPNFHPQQHHPQQNPFISATSTSSSPFDSRQAAGRNIEIPIQIAKSSSSPAPSKKVDNSFQGAANLATAVNESASDPAIADPNQVYAMGYEPINSAPNHQNAEKSNETAKKETPFDYVKEVLDDLKNYESQVAEFSCTSTSDKGYRYLDEMLTLCILRLDCINIDGNDELRKYRKSAINEVNRVAAILETKVSKAPADNTAAEKTPSQQNESQGQQQQCSNGDAATLSNGSVAQPKPEDNQTAAGAVSANTTTESVAAEPKNKKEAKKLEKAKAKKEKEEKEKAKKEAAATGEKKEGRRIILFRGKNKNKAAAAQSNDEAAGAAASTSNAGEAMDLDTNNNDLKDGKDGSTSGSQSASDQASETASSTTSSSTTLQGKETAV